MSRLRGLARRARIQRALRTAPARRLTHQLVTAQRVPDNPARRYAPWAELERAGPAPLEPARTRPDDALRVAFVVPEFRRGSGGHTTIANLVRALGARGHVCSVWIDDPLGGAGGATAFRAYFGPLDAPVHDDLSAWTGADVVLATGWQTVATVLRLPGCAARAHLVQDEEPEFYPASAERLWAERGHGFGLPCVTAGAWLAERMRARGATATPFALGIDLGTYRPQPGVERVGARVLFYARAATPRRAVPLGLLALAELRRRRSETEFALFGDAVPVGTPFPATHLGVLEPAAVARAYAEATVGLVLSLTNHSLAAQEMAACGLPAVEARTPSTLAAFGDAPIELAETSVLGLADALERLLADPDERARRSESGPRWAAARTWSHAAEAVEQGLRDAVAAAS